MINNSSFINAYTHLRDLDRKITHRKVADATGFSRSLINQMLNNKKALRAEFTKKFEEVYNLNLKNFREKEVLPMTKKPPIDWQLHVNTRFVEQEGYNLEFNHKLDQLLELQRKLQEQNELIIKLLKTKNR